jgi:hypothetical protein
MVPSGGQILSFKPSHGTPSTTLKATWSYGLPIYVYMEFFIPKKESSEDEALQLLDDVFYSSRGRNANKRKLG